MLEGETVKDFLWGALWMAFVGLFLAMMVAPLVLFVPPARCELHPYCERVKP